MLGTGGGGMSRDEIQVRLVLSRRQLRGVLALLILVGIAGAVASQTGSVSATYPAPSGVYRRLRATMEAYLASDGGAVGIGTSAPTHKLDISGGGMILRSSMTLGGMPAPGLSSGGQASLYFDSAQNKLLLSENGGSYASVTGGPVLLSRPVELSRIWEVTQSCQLHERGEWVDSTINNAAVPPNVSAIVRVRVREGAVMVLPTSQSGPASGSAVGDGDVAAHGANNQFDTATTIVRTDANGDFKISRCGNGAQVTVLVYLLGYYR